MYNRYIRNDDGVYARHTQQEAPNASRASAPPPPPSAPPPPPAPSHSPSEPQAPHSPETGAPAKAKPGGELQFLSRILDRLHLGDIDAGDLLLLMMMFYLFHEGGDEELLIAIGLLLIL